MANADLHRVRAAAARPPRAHPRAGRASRSGRGCSRRSPGSSPSSGFAALTIGEIASEAGVSRGAFYEHFDGKEECLLSAYDHFASTLIGAMTRASATRRRGPSSSRSTLGGYLRTLEGDPVAARAFMVEFDAAGERARDGGARRCAASRRCSRAATPRCAPRTRGSASCRRAPISAIVLGVRELVREALETEPAPRLTELAPDILLWLTATIEGAEAALVQSRRYET